MKVHHYARRSTGRLQHYHRPVSSRSVRRGSFQNRLCDRTYPSTSLARFADLYGLLLQPASLIYQYFDERVRELGSVDLCWEPFIGVDTVSEPLDPDRVVI